MLFAAGSGVIGGAAAAAATATVLATDRERSTIARVERDALLARSTFVGAGMEPAAGKHQSGVVTAPQAHSVFAAFDLREGVDAAAVGRLMRLLTDDITRVTSGRAALADTAAELAATPARLTVTVGFGPGLFARTGLAEQQPAGLVELPAFPKIDRLQDRWSGGDLLLHICADDAMVVAHTQRMLLKDTRAFAVPRWFQRGFRRAMGSGVPGSGDRNLMGQIDGTVNPAKDSEFDAVVWNTGPGWFAGGTTMVLRRIRMDLDRWDELDRSAMEQVMGRHLDTGAPLGGSAEHEEPDLAALDFTGLKAIPDFAHLRLARGDGPARQILRRPYNYDDSPDADGASDVGQLFCSYQADIGRQFVPMQQRLAESDLLNKWTTPVGSAVFAILPGFEAGQWLGQGLLG